MDSSLGAFLRSRRDRLTPAQAGIATFPGVRRVPGLRKEEVAHLAGLSTDHYSRIEQGRQPALSDDICDALARALHLDPTESAHLRALAAPGRRREVRPGPQLADPGLLRVMANLDHVPTLLLGRYAQVLARGGPLDAVLGVCFEPGTSFARWYLFDPAARKRIVNWDHFARAMVGTLRYETARHPSDRHLAALVGDLRSDPDARLAQWWDDRTVSDHWSWRKQVAHPVAGPLDFGIEAVTSPHDADQRLVIYTVEPDSRTARMLPLLRAWGVDASDLDRGQLGHGLH
ncbi:helix-turn-helix domain-containing protein [Actinoplanes sp. LDG1-06]|uniref:Helix-turn-helix domain-containing protein n=1 Tax=Paractinoplanes ovalisporus TaxID=2810368 RepID=A0ABS2ASN5_9ACTN|nr:helix-turn-helix transcriptional regulator [Actinoplanes ovalisporus]MBM2622892.1 helix-turn-helix domain-containing protein [Actinoplanes ovalisporus]